MPVRARDGLHIGLNHGIIFTRSKTSTVGTDLDEYFPPGGRWVANPYYRGMILLVNRTAESANDATLLVIVQMYNQATATFSDMIDGATGTLSTVSYATSSTGERWMRIYPGSLGADADGVLIVNTVHKFYDAVMPPQFRLRVRHGGTSVTNTFSIFGAMLK